MIDQELTPAQRSVHERDWTERLEKIAKEILADEYFGGVVIFGIARHRLVHNVYAAAPDAEYVTRQAFAHAEEAITVCLNYVWPREADRLPQGDSIHETPTDDPALAPTEVNS